jgi:hypothetical protein
MTFEIVMKPNSPAQLFKGNTPVGQNIRVVGHNEALPTPFRLFPSSPPIGAKIMFGTNKRDFPTFVGTITDIQQNTWTVQTPKGNIWILGLESNPRDSTGVNHYWPTINSAKTGKYSDFAYPNNLDTTPLFVV